MVRKKKSKTLKFKGFIKQKKIPKIQKATAKQIATKLSTKKEQTLKRIIESKGASTSAKARALKLLNK